MKWCKIEVEILSDTLFATSAGSVVVDSMTAAYKNGIPYIPAKTLKGLLKESAIEVLEIAEEAGSYDDINRFFGKEGAGNSGLLSFSNADVANKEEIEREIAKYGLLPSEVLSVFTKIRQQTAMENGVAKNGSLRTSSVLKKGLKFTAFLESNSEIDNKAFELLRKACLNLRRVGLNRNRGFGKVKVEISGIKESRSTKELEGNMFKITLRTPILLPSTGFDANTVSSEKIISGRKIMGMLANRYIEKNGLYEDADNDPTFRELFLKGDVEFSDAYPVEDGRLCFPLGNHWMTTKDKNSVASDFESNEGGNWKAIGGLYSHDGTTRCRVATVLSFHNSRNKINQSDIEGYHTRVSGSNKGAGIFYYEKLDAGQSFVFKLSGEEKYLSILRELLSASDYLRLGKSVSTNLGRIDIEEWHGQWLGKQGFADGEQVVVTFISPVIVKDAKGEYNPCLEVLSEYLKTSLEADKCRIRTKRVNVFQGKIKMQLPEMVAIASGSSIVTSYSVVKNLSALGEFTHEGFGHFIVEKMNNEEKKISLKKTITHQYDSSDEQGAVEFKLTSASSFLKNIIARREVLRAVEKANRDAPKLFHKGTTMLMIGLFKEVKQQLYDGGRFEDALEKCLEKEFEKGVYSKKTIESLEKIFGNLGQDDSTKRERKENLEGFKRKVKEWIKEGVEKKVEEAGYKSGAAKVEYWLAFFDRTKINNRNE